MQCEAAAILDGPSVLDCAFVRSVLEELIDEAPMPAVDLDTVHSSSKSYVERRLDGRLDIPLGLSAEH